MGSLDELEARVSALEKKHYKVPANVEEIDEQVRRARAAVQEKARLYSSVWKWVPTDYYQRSLAERAKCLGASSVDFLCKSLLLENKKMAGGNNDVVVSSPKNPRFVLVILQYAATLDVKKLTSVIRRLLPVSERLDESMYDFRIAAPEDNDRITGYANNAVTPFGLQEPVPIILTENVVKLRFFWMGGGHIHLKLGVATSEFCEALNPIIGDISNPRTGEVDAGDMED